MVPFQVVFRTKSLNQMNSIASADWELDNSCQNSCSFLALISTFKENVPISNDTESLHITGNLFFHFPGFLVAWGPCNDTKNDSKTKILTNTYIIML